MVVLANLLGNIPLCPISTIYYRFTITISLLFWLRIIVCVFFTQLHSFLAHIIPYGSPIALGLFLPLVEIFSQLIRPFTLIIRLRTNLSSGHIMLFIFSYFSSLSSLISPFIFIVLVLLLVLEFCISILQGYIFVSLISLYLKETI
jgi:ATP synthase subunit 6